MNTCETVSVPGIVVDATATLCRLACRSPGGRRPCLVRLLLCFCGLEAAVLGHGSAMEFIQILVERLTFLPHGIFGAIQEVFESRQALESRHGEGLRASQGHERYAMSRSRLKLLRVASQVDDDALFDSQALRFVNPDSEPDTDGNCTLALFVLFAQSSIVRMGTHFGSDG